MKYLQSILAVSLLLTGTAAAASESYSGYVTKLSPMNNGAYLFWVSGARSAVPTTCQYAVHDDRWVVDANTPAGQAKLATLLTAYSLHQPIHVWGQSRCDVWADTETVDYFNLGGG